MSKPPRGTPVQVGLTLRSPTQHIPQRYTYDMYSNNGLPLRADRTPLSAVVPTLLRQARAYLSEPDLAFIFSTNRACFFHALAHPEEEEEEGTAETELLFQILDFGHFEYNVLYAYSCHDGLCRAVNQGYLRVQGQRLRDTYQLDAKTKQLVPLKKDQEPLAVFVRQCFHCGVPESGAVKMKMCAQCSHVYYCSLECQRADWVDHKHWCKRVPPLVERIQTIAANDAPEMMKSVLRQ